MSCLTENEARQIEAQLRAFLPEAELARRLGVTRQFLNQRPEHTKRAMGGIRAPWGWIYQLEQALEYRESRIIG